MSKPMSAFCALLLAAAQQAPPPAQLHTPQAAKQPAPASTATPKLTQHQKPTTEGSIPDAKPAASCVILKRMGPADEITSHLYSFGIRGKQFQYVEGNLPQGISFHGRLTDHDARKILDKGGKIEILEPKYTPGDLDAARRLCSRLRLVTTGVGKDAPKQDEKAGGTASIPSDRPFEAPTKDAAQPISDSELTVTSSPAGADIELDGNFVGSTPSTIGASPGDHVISIRKNGFQPWERKLKISAGKVGITADLQAEAAQSSAVETTEATRKPEQPKQASETAAPVARADATAAGGGPISTGPDENIGTIIVTSEPTGAEIYLDNSPAGIAPLTLKLKPGKHSIRAFKKGQQNWLKFVTIEAGQDLSLKVAMQKSE